MVIQSRSDSLNIGITKEAYEYSRNDCASLETWSNKLKWQWSKAASMLGDYKTFIEVWGEALNSQGFSAEQVGMQLDTLSRRMGKLKADIEGMAVSTGNDGLAVWLKQKVSGIDNLIVGLKQIPKEVYMVGIGLASMTGILRFASFAMNQYAVATTGATVASRALARSNIGAAALAVLAVALSQVAEHYGNIANKERDAAQAGEDHIAIAEQQIEQTKKQGEFIDSLFSARAKLIAQTNDATVTDEKKIELTKNVGATEVELGKILGAEAMQRIKENNWSMESINAEKTTFQQSVVSKQEALVVMRAEMAADLDNKIIWLNNCITAYYDEAAAFGDSISKKITMLGVWRAAMLTAQEWMTKFNEGKRDNANEMIEKYRDDPQRLAYWQNVKAKADNDIEYHQNQGKDIVDSGASQWKSQLAEAKGERLKVATGGLNFNPANVGGYQVSDSGDGKDHYKAEPHDTTANVEDKVDLHEQKRKLAEILHNAKLAKDLHESVLDSIKTQEEIEGVTAYSVSSLVGEKQSQMTLVKTQNETLESYIAGLEVLIDAHIATNDELRGKLKGSDGKDYKDMDRKERSYQRNINTDLLSNDTNLSGYMSLKNKAEDKVSENNKEYTTNANDVRALAAPRKPQDIYKENLERNATTQDILIAQNTNKLDQNNEVTLNAIKLHRMQEDAKLHAEELVRLNEVVAQAKKDTAAAETAEQQASAQKQLDIVQMAADKQRAIVAKNAQEIKDLEYSKNSKIKEGLADIVDDVVVKGGSLKSIWSQLWNQLASDAIKALFRVQNTSGSLLGSIFGMLGGGVNLGGVAPMGVQGPVGSNGGFFKNFADGGLSDKPAIFGEAGLEMAIPMSPGKRSRALELYQQTGQMLGVGTKVVPNISPRTTEIAQNASLSNKEVIERIDRTNALLESLANITLNKEVGGGGQGNTQVAVLPTTQGDGELWAQINRMRSTGYKV